MEFFFDVETSGFHKKALDPADPTQAWTVQLGFILSDFSRVYQECCFMFIPPHIDSSIHPAAEKTHGISVTDCKAGGISEFDVADVVSECLRKADVVVCHNYNFDSNFMTDLLTRCFVDGSTAVECFTALPSCCTMLLSTNYCNLPGRYGKPKWPKLEELYLHLFNEFFEGAHDALADVRATRRCYYELKERGVL